jgi:hypothetical protein
MIPDLDTLSKLLSMNYDRMETVIMEDRCITFPLLNTQMEDI